MKEVVSKDALEMACGAGFGFLIAFLITALVNALH